jgi:hypothetical protein
LQITCIGNIEERSPLREIVMRASNIAATLAAWTAVAALSSAFADTNANAELDSEHLFGFTEGTDIGQRGDRELENEVAGRMGKRAGAYRAYDAGLEAKFSVFDEFRVAPGVSFSQHNISGVPGLPNTSSSAIEGFHVELKYRALDRARTPFGLTFVAIPRWTRVDELSGERVDAFGAELGALIDQELVAGTLFGAINVRYAPTAIRVQATGAWEHDSAIQVSGALAGRITPGFFLGGELRYVRSYQGLALDSFSGAALFAGPTFYSRLVGSAWIAGGWNVQIAGQDPLNGGNLNLVDFERHEFKVRTGFNF